MTWHYHLSIQVLNYIVIEGIFFEEHIAAVINLVDVIVHVLNVAHTC
jgi:hypothetical protein